MMISNIDTSVLGERVLLLRRKSGLTQKELGDRTGLGANTIARLERGAIRDLKFQNVIKMSDVFDVSLDYLAGKKM